MARPGRKCRACIHRERAAIDLALARRVSVSAIARRYGISTDTLYNHQKSHLSPQLRAKLLAGPDAEIDLDKLMATESQSWLANLVALRHRLFASLDSAEECGDGAMISKLAGQLHKNLELSGQYLGDITRGSTSVTNILLAPQYVEMRVELVRALAPFPEARQAVAAVLHRLEDKAAADVRPMELAQ
jgi:transposase-like protein